MARDVGKGVLYVAGAGAVVALLANLDDLKNSKEVKDKWWLLPLGILTIGYLLRKRGNAYANTVLAVGGAMFALAYAAQSKQAQAQQPAQPKQVAPKQREAGAPFTLIPGPQGFAWVQMPDGQFLRVPLNRTQVPPRVAESFAAAG
ncbi:hypothetical protein [Polyangium sp. 6x1]|uniref:hypothetical protein n=1 Tax=Polyangium sp. 6x1 TaxID=3042689 RepID=UPI002482F1E5|nr:hypothetical protein [Polyangium sp. 6x1]